MFSRFDYVTFDNATQQKQAQLLAAYKVLESMLNKLEVGRGKASALTKLEESYMWAGKALRDGLLNQQEKPEKLFQRIVGKVEKE